MSDLHNQSEEMDVEIQRGGVRSTPIKGDQHRSPLVVEEFHADNDDLLRLEETFQPLQEEPPPAEFEYAEKLFVRKPKDNHYPYSAAQQIWEAVRANDKKALYRHIVNSETDVNAVHEQVACNSSLTLAKAMLLNEQTSLDQSSRCLTGNSSGSSSSSLNLAGTSEGQTMDDLEGCSLLHLACETGDIGMLELLLQYGANINATDLRGQTPLHRCILRGRATFAKLLLSRGADPRAVNGEGKSSLELALESNFVDSDVLPILSDSNG